MNLLERFLKYVKIDTKSDETSTFHPSTQKQFNLARLLVNELTELGLTNIELTDNCIVYATLNSNCNSTTKIGFIAHMDTAPSESGENVKPNIIENYDGNIITLKNGVTIDPIDFPNLLNQKGHTLITTDGTTLLGADDKAGITEIMEMLSFFVSNPLVKHHTIKVAFTPDEEIGEGTACFDIQRFDADYAYTVDGGKYDEFSYECFNAASAHIEIKGVGIHPGEAKDKMVNAARIAIEFDTLLPEFKRPEYTTKYEGFNHLTEIKGNESLTTLDYIIRNHSKEELEIQKNEIKAAIDFLKVKHKKAEISLIIKDSYSNMRYDIERYPHVIDSAINAMKEEGINAIIDPIRGGTDGAHLSSQGLPCPNMPTGGYNYHGIREYASLDEMKLCAKYLINIAKL